MTAPESASRKPKQLDAGSFQPEISSFRLHLAAEGKAAKTVRTYTEAVQSFAGEHLLKQAVGDAWKQVTRQDVQQWIVWLLDRYSSAYASNQYRALQQFFKWLAGEEEIPDPMARLKPPHVPEKPVPISMPRICRVSSAPARAGRSRSAATRRSSRCSATGIRAGEIARIRYCPDDAERSDVDLQNRTIRVRGKGRRERVVPIGHDAARALDRYIRVRSRHAQAWRPQLWLGVDNRGPMTASGIYQMISRRGRQCGLHAWPYRFRHHFSHTWLDRGGAEGDLMELNGWTSPQMLRLYGASARSARARRAYDRIMEDRP